MDEKKERLREIEHLDESLDKLRECYEDRQTEKENYKKNHPCVICGMDDYRCLHIHHIYGRTRNETLVLCANCHAIEHHKLRHVVV